MLVSMKEILQKASEGNYAVAAPNIYTELDCRAYIEAAEEMHAPLIIDYFAGDNSDIGFISALVHRLASESPVPIALNLDHGGKKKEIISAIANNFTSVMVDRSSLPFDENVKEVKEIVDIAHEVGISVEAELGHVGQADNYSEDRNAALTTVEDCQKFIELTGVDCLAIAIGTAHGSYPKGFKPYLDFDRLVEIKKGTNNFPLVLHGSSGTDIEDIRKACTLGINKVNIANDLCQAAVKALKEADLEGNGAYDVYMTIANSVKQKLKEMIEVYGSKDKAWTIIPSGVKKGGSSMSEA